MDVILPPCFDMDYRQSQENWLIKMAPFENLQPHLGSKKTKKLTAGAPQEVPLGKLYPK
jgi:hypothetical protein